MEHQEEGNWCWAAVSASVDRYFNPAKALAQCAIASKVLAVKNCCYNKDAHNEPAALDEAFWLKAISGKSKDDFVVPFLTTAKELLVMHPYEAGKFLAIAQELANKRLAAKDLAPKPPKPEPAPNTRVRTATTSGA